MTTGLEVHPFVDFLLVCGGIASALMAILALLAKTGVARLVAHQFAEYVADVAATAVEPMVSEQARKIEQQVGVIRRELTPNGGLSLRDQTNRIEANLSGHVAVSSDEREQLSVDVEAVRARLADHASDAHVHHIEQRHATPDDEE